MKRITLRIHGVLSIFTPFVSGFLAWWMLLAEEQTSKVMGFHPHDFDTALNHIVQFFPARVVLDMLAWYYRLADWSFLAAALLICGTGIVKGLRHRREKGGVFCLWASIFGLVVFVVLAYGLLRTGRLWGLSG